MLHLIFVVHPRYVTNWKEKTDWRVFSCQAPRWGSDSGDHCSQFSSRIWESPRPHPWCHQPRKQSQRWAQEPQKTVSCFCIRNTVKPDHRSIYLHKSVTLLSNSVVFRHEADVTKVLDMDRKAVQITDAAGKESGVAQNTLKQLSDLEKKLPKPPTVVNLN